MRKFLVVGIALALGLAAGPVWTDAQTPAPGTTPPPGTAAPADRTPPRAPAERMDKKIELSQVEGKVKKVDPAENKIQVGSGLFGMLGRTVSVTSDTDILVDGRKATLADIREGAQAKVSYESRDGRNVARSIEVLPAEQRGERTNRTNTTGAPARSAPGATDGTTRR
jgi:hypothetical protein